MTNQQVQKLGEQIVKALAPMIQSMAELSELKQIGKESITGFVTHRDLQTWMSQRSLSLTNGHKDYPQVL